MPRPSKRPFELACPACGDARLCGYTDMVLALVQLGKTRADKEPDPEVAEELFFHFLPKVACRACGQAGLVARDADDGWPQARACADCGRPIPPERLEALPGATRCAACQAGEERGEPAPDAVDYCPRCGAPRRLRPAARGITRYVWRCTNPACRG